MSHRKRFLIFFSCAVLVIMQVNICSDVGVAQAALPFAVNGETFVAQGENDVITGETLTSTKAPNFNLYARSAVLMDADSGRVLYEKEGYVHMPNASTTKILTAILAIESGQMEEIATASAYAATRPKVRLGMSEGDCFYVKDLLYSLMLESHNDAAVVIAEHIGQSVEGFAALMNKKAKEIGCSDSYFITPNGLDAQDDVGVHGTTARDLALIMRYCIQNETFLAITRTPSYSFSSTDGRKSYSCNNHNAFLNMMDGALSGKTGFTGNAGYCYVGAVRRDERTFIVALLACGWPNNKSYKWADTKELMTYGLSNYQYEDIFKHKENLPKIPALDAIPNTGKPHDATYLSPVLKEQEWKLLKTKEEMVHTVYELPESLLAPVEAGSTIGKAVYFLDEMKLGELPITVEEGAKRVDFSWYFHYVGERFFL
ncbi:D-alanyl-D-alanine carboxypeptidase [Clostridia bacterium]|nr:D-alanyl-D-alanine carboxypeptidase [Clostridia bacterium]